MRAGVLAGLFLLTTACVSTAARSPVAESRQLIVVTSLSWDAIDGVLRRYERASATSPWQPAGDAVPVVLGRSGLAWGRGASVVPSSPPQKREGDGKSPAGVFALGTAFGFAETIDSRMPYAMLRDRTECVDDGTSTHYNEVVDGDRAARMDWTSSEKMRAIEQYRLGVVVNHNVPPRPGGGSCIFLHVWRDSSTPTAGCTAMSQGDLAALVRWLDPGARPRFVQLPRGEYDRRREEMGLPDLFMDH